MDIFISILLILLSLLVHVQDKQLKKYQRMYQISVKREEDVRGLASRANNNNSAILDGYRRAVAKNEEYASRLDASCATIAQLQSDLLFERSKNTMQDVYMDILSKERNDGKHRKAE